MSIAVAPPSTLQMRSEYLTLPDGVRLAASYWLKEDDVLGRAPRPVILTTTRYWRAYAFKDDRPEYQYFSDSAAFYYSRGYIFVAVDARGSGASFGTRDAELSPAEVDDIGDIIKWVSEQTWCDGCIATEGVSYTANTAIYSLVTAPRALKLAVCRASDLDTYRHLGAPGGIFNHWFADAWGMSVKAMDRNDAKSLMAKGYMPTPEGGPDNLIGVRPVDADRDGRLLSEAVAEHEQNYNVRAPTEDQELEYFDSVLSGAHRPHFDPDYQQRIEKSNVPLVVRCGWHDGGTALGALSMYNTFDAPIRLIIDPWNHTGNARVDPFAPGDGMKPQERTMDALHATTAEVLDKHLKGAKEEAASTSRVIEYYTLGENRWKQTTEWPLPDTRMERWYLAGGNGLSISAPQTDTGSDIYYVDPTASSGKDNRWHGQARLKPILFPDRREEDKKLLVYDTPPLERDVEITGHPVVHLELSSTAEDGQFFVYLETVDPDGRVRMLTDGCLRGLHRKVSNENPPYKMFGPYHSLLRKDAAPMIPGERTIISFDLFPLSVLLKEGQRIRLAIAGADCDTFAPIEGCECPELTIERNKLHASYIDLPIIDCDGVSP